MRSVSVECITTFGTGRVYDRLKLCATFKKYEKTAIKSRKRWWHDAVRAFYELWRLCQMKVVEQTNSFVVFNVAHIVMLKCALFTEKEWLTVALRR